MSTHEIGLCKEHNHITDTAGEYGFYCARDSTYIGMTSVSFGEGRTLLALGAGAE